MAIIVTNKLKIQLRLLHLQALYQEEWTLMSNDLF